MCYGGIAKECLTYIDSVDASMIGSNFIFKQFVRSLKAQLNEKEPDFPLQASHGEI